MISDRTRQILSGGVSEDREQTVIFVEGRCLYFVFRLFRASDHAGDPEQQAIRWLGKARGLCRSAHGGLKTGVIRSKDGASVMAAVSGRKIEAVEE